MGRRAALTMSKMVLPTVSWVAVIRLLKKTPKSLPASQHRPAEMALKAFMGCSQAPQTDSLRYADDYLGQTKGRGGGGRRPKPAALLPGCTSRPHTDSFRVHHVVNQEALQLMLSFRDYDDADADADFDYEGFFESDELCYGIIRDGDRLLHDDIYADDSACASSSMGTCSSRLSAATSRSIMASTTYSATLSRNSVDSEGVYSTATSASFGNTPSTPELTCNSTPSTSTCGASELIYSDAISDHDLKLEAREEVEEMHHQLDVEGENDAYSAEYNDWNEVPESKRDQMHPTSSCAEDGELHAMSWSAGDELYLEDAGHQENYEGDGEEEEEEDDDEEAVAEMRYSEDPLEDFVEAISCMVVSQQLNKVAQLQELYCRFLRLNAPSLHRTITLAFLHALQRLASYEPHLLHTLV